MKRSCLGMRSARGTARRNACACKVQAVWNAFGSTARAKSCPPLTYSINRRDLTGAELGMLLAASHTGGMVGPEAAPLCRQNYSYWRSPEGLQQATKLEMALQRSVAIVACFTTWDVYGDAANCGSGADGSGAVRGPAVVAAGAKASSRPCEQQHNHQHILQQHEEGENPLAAARYEREREMSGRRCLDSGRDGGGDGGFGARPAAAATTTTTAFAPSSAFGNWGDTCCSPSSPSSSSPSPSSSSSSPWSPSPSSSSSSSSLSLPGWWLHSEIPSHPSSPCLGAYGSKPTPPPGVPDMEWNWLMPSGQSNASSSYSSSSNYSSGKNSCSSDGSVCQGYRGVSSGSSTVWPFSASASASASLHTASVQQQTSLQWNFTPSSINRPSSLSSTSSSRAPRKSLVGFARATGDNSTVATIYDVAVHPAVRSQGIGRRLVKLLVQQIQARAVYDVGVVMPAAAAGFWERCSFDDDREGSTFMMFLGGGPAVQSGSVLDNECDNNRLSWEVEVLNVGEGDLGAPYSSQELLRMVDRLGHWGAAQRSESLQALLAEKLHQLREDTCGPETAMGSRAVAADGVRQRRLTP